MKENLHSQKLRKKRYSHKKAHTPTHKNSSHIQKISQKINVDVVLFIRSQCNIPHTIDVLPFEGM